MTTPEIRIERLHKDAVIPAYKTAGAAGADLHLVLDDRQLPIVLEPGERRLFATGLRFAIPEGWEVQVRPRSGLALNHGITVLNAPGTIDSDYRGEIAVMLINLGADDMTFHAGDRIAQMVVARAPQAALVEGGVAIDTARGAGGFGSTGVAA